MFTYSLIKHEDTENGVLYGLYETTQDDDGEVLVMGNAPVNGVFYESIDELVEHYQDISKYIQGVASGENPIVDADSVTFVEMENECCNEEGCGCEDEEEGDWNSFDDADGSTSEGKKPHKQCCGGGCGCHHI